MSDTFSVSFEAVVPWRRRRRNSCFSSWHYPPPPSSTRRRRREVWLEERKPPPPQNNTKKVYAIECTVCSGGSALPETGEEKNTERKGGKTFFSASKHPHFFLGGGRGEIFSRPWQSALDYPHTRYILHLGSPLSPCIHFLANRPFLLLPCKRKNPRR